MIRAVAAGLFLALSILAADTPGVLAQQHQPYYNPADSVVYLQISDHWFRCREGGARLEQSRTAVTLPAYMLAFNGIPGQLYACDSFWPFPAYVSTDCGDTWAPDDRPGVRAAAIDHIAVGWGGVEPGASWVGSWRGIFFTRDNWESYDSLRPFFYCEALVESLTPVSLSYEPGVVYGCSEQTSTLCVSSDTGQTWAAGGIVNVGFHINPRIGAYDELWMMGAMDRVVVALDTGRTLLDSVFQPHPPEFPYPWHFALAPTNHPGEAYLLAEIDHWGTPNVTDLIFYHIRNYGAAVDSFGYRLVDWELASTAGRPALPARVLLTASPNPFNAGTDVRFWLPRAGQVALKAYDLQGREVAVLTEGVMAAGEHRVLWEARGQASGVYFVRLAAGEAVQTRKVLLVR